MCEAILNAKTVFIHLSHLFWSDTFHGKRQQETIFERKEEMTAVKIIILLFQQKSEISELSCVELMHFIRDDAVKECPSAVLIGFIWCSGMRRTPCCYCCSSLPAALCQSGSTASHTLALHPFSWEFQNSFIALNCSALSETDVVLLNNFNSWLLNWPDIIERIVLETDYSFLKLSCLLPDQFSPRSGIALTV